MLYCTVLYIFPAFLSRKWERRFFCIAGDFLIIRWGIFNFKIYVFNIKIQKVYRIRRVGKFSVLIIDKYRYSENCSPRKVKISHCTGHGKSSNRE
jgi:hypothetical protein